MVQAGIAAEEIRKNKKRILDEWEQRIRQHLVAAGDKHKAILLDDLPEFIDSLAQVLAEPSHLDAMAHELHIPAKKHGQQRANIGDFAVDDVLEEYKILRQVVFEVIEVHGPLHPKDRDLILDAIYL